MSHPVDFMITKQRTNDSVCVDVDAFIKDNYKTIAKGQMSDFKYPKDLKDGTTAMKSF